MKYDKLISTIPLDMMCRQVKGKGLEDLASQAPHFRYSTTHVVGIGLRGQPPEKLQQQCWMYFPEDDCPFYRVTVFSNYSPYNVPKPGLQWSLMAEVCETVNRPVDVATVVDDVIKGMLNTRLLAPEDVIISRFHRRLEHGYPTPFLGRDELCKPIFQALEAKGIFSRGRFGAWKYEVSNQDHTMMQGVEAVDHVLFG
jgi:protoporphyrinogen oxidase